MLKNAKIAHVKVIGENDSIIFPVGSTDKPIISDSIIKKWQNITDLLTQIFNVPASLIMKINENRIKVFVSSSNEGNPYKKGDTESLEHGLYCETVIGNRLPLIVPNASIDPEWENNPDMKINMVSYCGLPISWVDGEIFGTLCVLDKKENNYSELYFNLMTLFKENIELDLRILQEREGFKRLNYEKELLLREIHHRVKNNFNTLLSLLRLQKKDMSNENILDDLKTRIKTISLIHEKLSLSTDISNINLNKYINELVTTILDLCTITNIKFNLKTPEIAINNKEMLPLGLLINELTTNSLKHSFKNITKPEIDISITHINNGFFNLEYFDNGIGLPDDFNIKEKGSLGMRLIQLLTKQLDGQIIIITGKETSFKFKLKIK